jgi:hypothetical protein
MVVPALKRRCSILALAATLEVCPMSDLAAEPASPSLASLEVETAPEYVVGFPVHVAVTIRADQPDASLRLLPYADFFKCAGAFGLTLIRAGSGQAVVSVQPRPVVDRSLGIAVFSLPPNQSRRMLIDLSAFLPADLAPGDYQATLAYGPPNMRAVSPAFALRLRAPAREECAELAALLPGVRTIGGWGQWILQPPSDRRDPPKVRKTDPLRFNRVLRWWLFGERLEPSLVQALDGIYAPEADALTAELYQVAGDQTKFEQQAQAVRTRHHGLSWWMDDLAAGRGIIAFHRGQR